MINPRWLVATPLLFSALFVTSPALASNVRDHARMFSSEAVEKAQAELNRLERATHIPVVIETINKVPGLARDASAAERQEAVVCGRSKRNAGVRDYWECRSLVRQVL